MLRLWVLFLRTLGGIKMKMLLLLKGLGIVITSLFLQSCTPVPPPQLYFVNSSGTEVELTNADLFQTHKIPDGGEILLSKDSDVRPTKFTIKSGSLTKEFEVPEAWNLNPSNKDSKQILYFSSGKNKVVLMQDGNLYVWPTYVENGKAQVRTKEDLLKYPEYQPDGFPISMDDKEK